MGRSIVVGVLSDTHGPLHPGVKAMLEGVDHIIHAGDVGSREVLSDLETLAPVTAVRGNCDVEAWARSLPLQAEVELGGVRILVGHMASRLKERLLTRGVDQAQSDPGARSSERHFQVVVTGHSHRTESEERDGILHLNPGSAGPERFGRRRTLARLLIILGEVGEESEEGHMLARIGVEFLAVDGRL